MYRSEVMGRGGITTKVVEATISPKGNKITTMELTYPRFIHSEFMTHRVFSRNASSSRAIPIDKMIKQVEDNPAMPIEWGSNQAGMQAGEEVKYTNTTEANWVIAARLAVREARNLQELKLHKQIVNRILEPFQFITVVVTSTEWDNFFELRDHEDAQPEIRELAQCMKAAMAAAKYRKATLHCPYVSDEDKTDLTASIKELLMVSAARCARVSYLTHGGESPSARKDMALAERLLSSKHMSPFEHQARFIGGDLPITLSGNFRGGWSQHRQSLDG